MGLYERWTSTAEDASRISVHPFMAALREYSRGSVTRQQIVDAFSLTSEDESELDAIVDKYTNLSTQEERDRFLVKFHDVMLLSEAGHYPKTKAKDELGF